MISPEDKAMNAYPIKMADFGFTVPDMIDLNEESRNVYREGYEQAMKDLGWHDASVDLPPIDEEVIALTNVIGGKEIPTAGYICYAHRPDPNGWDGRNIETGEITHYQAKMYDGWNIPGVKFWMYCPEIPGIKE